MSSMKRVTENDLQTIFYILYDQILYIENHEGEFLHDILIQSQVWHWDH